jgi:hypothetical protein
MWGVPVDDSIFDSISPKQWMWYFYNFLKDQEEDFEGKRDFVEYHASFIEPQVVKKIKDEREGKSDDKTVKVSDDDFTRGLKSLFGRDVDLNTAKERSEQEEKNNLNSALNTVKRGPNG